MSAYPGDYPTNSYMWAKNKGMNSHKDFYMYHYSGENAMFGWHVSFVKPKGKYVHMITLFQQIDNNWKETEVEE